VLGFEGCTSAGFGVLVQEKNVSTKKKTVSSLMFFILYSLGSEECKDIRIIKTRQTEEQNKV